MTRVICGVDVSSSSLVARIGQDGEAASASPTSQEGIAELAAFCQNHEVELVAMEATGGYEQRAFAQLSEHGLPVAVVNPACGTPFRAKHGATGKDRRHRCRHDRLVCRRPRSPSLYAWPRKPS